jgi:cysteine desulfurase
MTTSNGVNKSRSEYIYFDYAATTPVDAEVLSAMEPYFKEKSANPSSLHLMGQEARRAVDDAREQMKNFLNASSLREIIFTGSATEANNLAIFGVIKAMGHRPAKLPHIITTAIEHKSALAPCQELEKKGEAEVTYLKPNKEGFINAEELRQALRPDTALISVMYANNEIGTIQPIAEISEIIKEYRKNNLKITPFFHCDAVQAAGFLDMDAQKLGVDLMVVSGHKIYGPKGIGALYVREGVKIQPLAYGGEQEYGMRPGTEAVSLIVGLGKATEITARWKSDKNNLEKILKLRNYLIDELLKIPGIQLNGSRENRLPNNANIALAGYNMDSLLINLFEKGICVSSGAACGARGREPSYVIFAISGDRKRAISSLRITLGRETNKKEIDLFLEKLIGTLA